MLDASSNRDFVEYVETEKKTKEDSLKFALKGMPCHADMRIIELSRTFHQVTQLFRTTN